jgi:hypothetical protein
VSATKTAPRPLRKRLRHLPSGLAASAVLLVAGVGVGAVLWGGAGAVGLAAGVTLVAASYTVSSLIIAWADSIDPRLTLPAGLMTYALKFTLFGLLLAVLARTGWAGLLPMGVGIMAGALGWTIAQAVWTWHARIPYVEIDEQH